jgi:Predicted membrane protein
MFIWDRWRRYASPSPVMAATAADPRVAETVAFPSGGLQPTPERGVPAPVERSRLGFAQGWRYYGVLHGVHYRGAEGPDGLEPWWTADAARRLAGSSPERLAHAARHLGIAYLLRSRRLPAGADVAAVTAIRAAGAEVLVHRLTRPAPACWMAAREIAVPSRAAAWHQLEDAASRPGADAVVLAPASGVRSHGPGSARLLARSPASWRVATSSAGAGLLVLDAAFSPSWIVRVDGRRTAPVLVNLCRIGVRVPPGDHRVTLTWSTRPFGTGLLLAAFGWTIVGWLGLIAARDRRRPPSDAPGPRRPASPPGR